MSFFKKGDDVTLLGVRAPQIRAVAKQIHDQVKQSWEVTDALAFAEILAPRPQFEAKMVGILVLGRYQRLFPRSLLTRARQWVDAGWFPNWAAIDGLCPAVTTPLLRKYPSQLVRVTRWGSSRNHWLRRASVVTLVPLARRGECLDEAYGLVASLRDDSEDLMHKACGWLLREAGKTDMRRLERFLLDHGPTVPRTTVRYAIERFPETRRRQLLLKTRD
jgi:3-methyladenine DNA glycosylase AlkD